MQGGDGGFQRVRRAWSWLRSNLPSFDYSVSVKPEKRKQARRILIAIGIVGSIGLAVLSGGNWWLAIIFGVMSLALQLQELNDHREWDKERARLEAEWDRERATLNTSNTNLQRANIAIQKQADEISLTNSTLTGKLNDLQSVEAQRISETIHVIRQLLAIFLGLADNQATTRVSVYVMTPRNDTVRLVTRATGNPELEGEPQAEYPKQGAILKAWTARNHFGPVLPDPEADLEVYVREAASVYNVPKARVRQSRMKPRRYFAWQLHGHAPNQAPCGVISIECQHEGREFDVMMERFAEDAELRPALASLAYQVQEYWRVHPARPAAELEG